eukprot:6522357-Heterocapsa_arctica.AAC.1
MPRATGQAALPPARRFSLSWAPSRLSLERIWPPSSLWRSCSDSWRSRPSEGRPGGGGWCPTWATTPTCGIG